MGREAIVWVSPLIQPPRKCFLSMETVTISAIKAMAKRPRTTGNDRVGLPTAGLSAGAVEAGFVNGGAGFANDGATLGARATGASVGVGSGVAAVISEDVLEDLADLLRRD